MVIKVIYTLDSKTLLGFSDFISANSAADWTTWEDWGSGGGVVVVVWGVWRDEAISKLKGAGATHASHAHTCMCPFYSAPRST